MNKVFYCSSCHRFESYYLEKEIYYTPTIIRRFYKCPKCGTVGVVNIDLIKVQGGKK